MVRCYFLSCLLLFGLLGCAALEQVVEAPQVEVRQVQLLPAEGLTQPFKLTLALTNPNAVTLNVAGLSYRVSLEGYDLISGVASDIPPLQPYTEVPVVLTASTNLLSAAGLVEELIRRPRREVEYVLAAKVDLGAWLPAFELEQSGVIPFTR